MPPEKTYLKCLEWKWHAIWTSLMAIINSYILRWPLASQLKTHDSHLFKKCENIQVKNPRHIYFRNSGILELNWYHNSPYYFSHFLPPPFFLPIFLPSLLLSHCLLHLLVIFSSGWLHSRANYFSSVVSGTCGFTSLLKLGIPIYPELLQSNPSTKILVFYLLIHIISMYTLS